MKTLFIALVATTALALVGCARSQAAQPAAPVVPAAVYKANRGLQFSPAATRLFEVRTGEVTSRTIGAAKNIAAVPTGAVLRTIKGDFIYVANGGWFLRTPVVIGVHDAQWSEIKEGLYEGDAVVITGVRALWLAELQAINGGGDDDDH